MKYLSLMLIALLLASCVSTQAKHDAAAVDYRIQQSLQGVRDGGSPTTPVVPTPQDQNAPRMNAAEIARANAMMQQKTTPTPQPGVSGWDVLGAAILFPLLLPVAMITNYPSYRGVHCRSYTYKDEYHTSCY